MAQIEEKRAHRRLDICLSLDYCPAGEVRRNVRHAQTLNVSTGGMYFETTAENFKAGDILNLELGVNPDDERFPPNSKISTSGQISRTTILPKRSENDPSGLTRYGVAVKFREGLKLTF